MTANQKYAAEHAEAAIEQQRKYGIPASVTLAQGILESCNGKSELAKVSNNHFGIKATSGWLNNGGDYVVFTDDKQNEKFCKYNSVADSYEHHSQFLKNNSRYSECFKLSQDDYKGWTEGIAKAGYASGSGYAKSLQKIIEANGLDKYDKEAMARGPLKGQSTSITSPTPPKAAASQSTSSDYSFPVKRESFLFITSPFGMRNDPINKGQQQMHKGIDIRCKSDALLATENNGKVVAVNHNVNTGGGKSVTVEYNRPDGSKVQNVYMHMSSIDVKVGDTVSAGQKLGVSGNTGTRSTGEHLHFGVKTISADGTKRDIDPAAYLAEIAQKGNISLQALHNGNDLMAKYKSSLPANTATTSVTADNQMSPDSWMKKLLSSEDSGVGISASGDPVVEMAMTMFSSLMLLAVQIDKKSENEQLSAISDMASSRKIDLSQLVSGMKQCNIQIDDNGKTVLHADNGATSVDRELTNAELSRLSAALNDTSLTDEAKRMRIAGMVNTIVLSQQASQNFEQGLQQSESQNQTIKR